MAIETSDIDGKSLALVVVDMQNKFAFESLRAGAEAILPTINAAVATFRERSRPVVFVKMEGTGHGIPDDVEDPDGFIDGLAVTEGDTVVHKKEMNAFFGTGLGEALRGMGVDGVVVCGLVSRFCVHATYFGAFDEGICPYLLKDGSASYNPDHTAHVESLCKLVTVEGLSANRDFRARPS